MRNFFNLLYVSHGTTDESEGLKQALSLARNNKAPLKVLVVGPEFPNEMPDYKQKYEASLLEQAEGSIQSTKEAIKLNDADVDISIDLICDDQPTIGIIQYVLRNGHDLLVKEAETSERDGGFKAIDMSLLRKCPCPVWLCRPISHSRKDIRIGVAIDPESSEKAGHNLSRFLLKLSDTLAADCSGELDVISCWNYEYEGFMRHNPWVRSNEDTIAEVLSQAQIGHRAALDTLIEESRITGAHEVHHLRGNAAKVIPSFAKERGIDILVMGTVARVGIPGFIFGNTAENIMQELSCSVMALKPQGFVSPVKAYN